MAEIKKGGYSLGDIYQGGYSSFNENYGSVFSGYHVNAKNFGLTTDVRTANILQDTQAKLATGAKQLEITGVSPDVFESIPQQHLKEMNRISKLTGMEMSVHAPIVEPSGIDNQGFSEAKRIGAEKQMLSAVMRSHEVNPDGNIPVTFHSSAAIPQPIMPKGAEFPEETIMINSQTGSIHPLPIVKRAFPGEVEKPSVKTELEKLNQERWSEAIRSMSYYANLGEREINEGQALATANEQLRKKEGYKQTEIEREGSANLQRGSSFLNDSYRQLQDMFELANKYCSDSDKKTLQDFSKRIEEKAIKIKTLNKPEDMNENIRLRRQIVDDGVKVFNEIGKESPPQIFKALDTFAKEKAVESFSNVAFESYKQFKDKSPIISIENPPAGGAFSSGTELKDLVEKTRQKFVDKAVNSGMSKSEAQAAAEKLIGVTWDVGHINMLKKYGYENKDILKETEAVKPLIKHIHLSDNFGLDHTELPMGMGNVPIKEIMEKLGAKGEEVKKIIEAGNWWQHFKTPPFEETLQAFGSPIYGMKMAPYWNQALGYEQGYYGGMSGQWLPQVNYETFGAGFSQLSTELGGQKGGAQGSRMSGRPME